MPLLAGALALGKIVLGKYAAAKAIALAGGLAAVSSVIGETATGAILVAAAKPSPAPIRKVAAAALDNISKVSGQKSSRIFRVADLVLRSIEETAQGKKKPSRGITIDVQALFGPYFR